MLKKAILLAGIILPPSGVFAANFGNFYGTGEESIKYFAKDIGTILGSGVNNTARSLGFSGFDTGYKYFIQTKPDFSNRVFSSGRNLIFGLYQAEIGMPYRIDGLVRASNFEGLTVVGGGLRYGLRQISDKPGYWHVMIAGVANLAVNRYFYATHFSSVLYFSRSGETVVPYAGGGFDNTKICVNKAADASLIGKKAYAAEEKLVLGVKFKFRFFYLALDGTHSHGRNSFLISGGMSF